jgi:hypothetical protein
VIEKVEVNLVNEDSASPTIIGDVCRKDVNSILVARNSCGGEFGGDIQFFVTEQTIITNEIGNRLTLDSIKVGGKVSVWGTGVTLETYPEQGTAKTIVVIR